MLRSTRVSGNKSSYNSDLPTKPCSWAVCRLLGDMMTANIRSILEIRLGGGRGISIDVFASSASSEESRCR